MDSLDTLYTIQAATQTAAGTTKTKDSTAGDTTFQELLASLSGNVSTGSSQMQQYLFAGLMDGSITVSDSSALVSALLASSDSEDGLAASSLDTAALLGFGQSTASDWLEAMETTSEDGEDGSLAEYYQALSSVAQAQKNVLLG